MKLSAVLPLFVATASFSEQAAAQTAQEIFYAISACCDNGCQDACDWKMSRVINPSAGVGSGGSRQRGHAVTRKLGEIEDNCCVSSGGSGGDPHIKAWNGEYFDYHGQCDLVLLDAPDFGEGIGMTIHIRTAIRHNLYSFISDAAVKIGEDTLEVTGFGEHLLNNVESANLSERPFQLGPFPLNYEMQNKKRHKFTIDLGVNDQGDSQAVIVETFKDWVNVRLENVTAKDFMTSKGLMGNFFTGTKLARDGTSVIQDVNIFGQEWQVLPEESGLFQWTDREPQAPQQCILPKNAMPDATQRRLGGSAVTEEAAELACQGAGSDTAKKMCVYDVLAANDLEMAQGGVF